jgi:peptide deformylase
MIYPITAYGDPVLRARATEVPADFEALDALIADMFETMAQARGVGLAAPQIGKSIRVFVIDSAPMVESADEDEKRNPRYQQPAVRRAFINPVMLAETGEEWGFDEGCLSIPGIHEQVVRPERVRIRYEDAARQPHEEIFDGIAARIIQHEYDHLEGILFTDHLNALKKRLLKNRLTRISKGDVDTTYRMRFAAAPGRR